MSTKPCVQRGQPADRCTVQVFFACVYCLLAAGVVFGFAAIKPVLLAEGVYRNRCSKQELKDDVRVCYEQELRCVPTIELGGKHNSTDRLVDSTSCSPSPPFPRTSSHYPLVRY